MTTPDAPKMLPQTPATTLLDQLAEGARSAMLEDNQQLRTEVEQLRAENLELRTECRRAHRYAQLVKQSDERAELRLNKLCHLLSLREDIWRKALPDGSLPSDMCTLLESVDRQISSARSGLFPPGLALP